jgi:hypothetical protein
LNEEASYSILVDNLWKLLIESGDAIAGGNRCKPDKLIAARIHPNNTVAGTGRWLLLLAAHFLSAYLDLASSLFVFLFHLLSSPPTYTLPRKATTATTTPNLLQASISLNRNSSLTPPTTCLPARLPLAGPMRSLPIGFTSASVASGKSFHPISCSSYIWTRSNPLL